MDIRVSVFSGSLEKSCLDLGQQTVHGGGNAFLGDERLPFASGPVAAGEGDAALLHIPGTDLHPDGHAAHLPVVELEAGADVIAIVHLNPDAGLLELQEDAIGAVHHFALLGIVLEDGHDHGLGGGQAGRQDQSLVVAVDHDHGADDAARDGPGGGLAVLQRVALIEILDIERLRKVLPEVMRRAGLQGALVPHHRLDGGSDLRAGELLGFTFGSGEDWDGGLFAAEAFVDLEDAVHLLHGLLGRDVGGVAFMPVELRCAQEELGADLPAQHRAPLHDQQRQVTPRFDPLGVHIANDGFGRGPDYQFLLQLFAAAVSDHGQLGRKPFHVLLLLFEERERDQRGERGVDVSGLLELGIQPRGDVLPQRPAVGFDHHTAAHGGIIRQIRFKYELVVPFGKVFGSCG